MAGFLEVDSRRLAELGVGEYSSVCLVGEKTNKNGNDCQNRPHAVVMDEQKGKELCLVIYIFFLYMYKISQLLVTIILKNFVCTRIKEETIFTRGLVWDVRGILLIGVGSWFSFDLCTYF